MAAWFVLLSFLVVFEGLRLVCTLWILTWPRVREFFLLLFLVNTNGVICFCEKLRQSLRSKPGRVLLNLVALPYFFHGKDDEWRCFLIFVDPQLLNSVPLYRRCGSHFQATRGFIDIYWSYPSLIQRMTKPTDLRFSGAKDRPRNSQNVCVVHAPQIGCPAGFVMDS